MSDVCALGVGPNLPSSGPLTQGFYPYSYCVGPLFSLDIYGIRLILFLFVESLGIVIEFIKLIWSFWVEYLTLEFFIFKFFVFL